MFSFFTKPIDAAERGGKRELLLTSLPLMLGMAADTIMVFTDRIFLAKHSDEAFQAAVPAGLLSFVFLCLFHQIACYAGTFVAQYHGAKSSLGCLRATAQGLWLAVFSIPFILLVAPLGWWLFALGEGLSEMEISLRREYFMILTLGGVRLPLAGALGGYFTGKGMLKRHVIANLAGTLVNIPLDYLFILGNESLGIPRMGIRGAAITTVISGMVPVVMQFWWYVRSEDVRTFGLRAAFAADFPLMWRVVRFGFPAGMQVWMDVGSFTLFFFLIDRLSGLEKSVATMCISINHLAFALLMAFGFAASIIAARYQGAKEPQLAARAGWSALKVGWCYMLPVAVVFVVAPQPFIALFHSPGSEFTLEQLLAVGRPMLVMMAVWGMADAANIVLMSALRGVGDTRFVMLWMTLIGWFVWIPLEWLAWKQGWGVLWMWGILTAYIMLLGVIFTVRWKRGKWMSIQVIEPVLITTREFHADGPLE